MTTPYEEDPSSDEPFFYASLNHDDPALAEPFLIDIPSGGTLGLFETRKSRNTMKLKLVPVCCKPGILLLSKSPANFTQPHLILMRSQVQTGTI